jgi:hypothetical protein
LGVRKPERGEVVGGPGVKVNYFQKGADVSESVISKDTAVDVKAQTIDRRRLHDRTLRQFTQALPHL